MKKYLKIINFFISSKFPFLYFMGSLLLSSVKLWWFVSYSKMNFIMKSVLHLLKLCLFYFLESIKNWLFGSKNIFYHFKLFFTGMCMNIKWVLIHDSKSFIKEVIFFMITFIIKDTLHFMFIYIPFVLILFSVFPKIEKYFLSFYESILKYEGPVSSSFVLDLWFLFMVFLIVFFSCKLIQMVCFYKCFEPMLDYYSLDEANTASFILFLLFWFLFFTKSFFWSVSSEFYSEALAHPLKNEKCMDLPWKKPHWKGLFSS